MKWKTKKSMGLPVGRLARSVLFFVILSQLLFLASYLFLPKNNLAEFGMEDVSANGILGEGDETIDVLILGDSEAFTSISPMEMWQKHGFTSYVCATSGQFLYTSDTFLKRALEKQKPKVVILETDAIYRDVSLSQSVMNRMENLFPVFRYHNRWKAFRSDELFSSVEYTWTDDFKGYVCYKTVDPALNPDYMNPTDTIAPVKALNFHFVKSMAAYCKAHGAELLLVSTPSTVNWNYERHNGIQKLANSLGLTYVDLNLEPNKVEIDWSADTLDKGDHLNYSGAVKVSTWLGEYLTGQYSLSDHREDSRYSKWKEALSRYQKALEE